MAEKGIGAVLVMQGGRLAGILSERDYARKVVLQGRASSNTLVRDIMTADVVSVGIDDTAERCMQIVTESRIRHLPVVDHDAVLGVVSIGDLVKAVIEDQQHERSEEHTSELQSLMRISYAVFCLKKPTTTLTHWNMNGNTTVKKSAI